ncbi:double-stranded RNA-binding protein 4-like isoform X1 [Camellia sinensis]|uniref:double-stranded RNA-binding protein 4-like isoform X1 n=2 Tax=Camellia sinensis TaxID=4442 RepID=UPI0010361C67|nr:double-stranded RNA-binding protein 4-like isoform X1 [Camellia sinensis]XP_028092518.1 double-stranded RNA-binding protein 4-like isoform X1 [Camellia sinensis]
MKAQGLFWETVFCKSILHEFPVFCKSILSEYAVKMHLEKPTYNTTRSVGLLPLRVSALVFNSVTYTGEAGKNKEAEQLAAWKVILSILDTSDSRTVITEIIKSIVKVNEGDSTQSGINPVAESTTGTIVFVSPAQALEQPLDVGSSSTKKRRKKAKKKSRDDAQLPVAVVA